MEEFTGDYYKCQDCNHIWDYIDTCCPECGSENEETINAKEVRQEASQLDYLSSKLIDMVESHGN